jgi:outer membrane biosynthesis protein TonB
VAMVESRSVSLSIVLHALALLIAAFGLPALLPKKTEPVPLVMTVELLPIGEISNVKPSDTPIQKEQKAPTPKITKPVPPTAKEKAAEPPPPEKKFDPMEDAEPLPSEKPRNNDGVDAWLILPPRSLVLMLPMLREQSRARRQVGMIYR